VPGPTSLLQAVPAVRRALAAEGVTEVGHLRVLPTLVLAAGHRANLGPEVVALIVLDGLLFSDAGRMAGPQDVIADPGTSWTACIPAEIAVAGAEFTAVAGEWPGTSAALFRLVRQWPIEGSSTGALDERVLNLLWRLAGRCGIAEARGMTMSLALDVRALAQLMRERPADVSIAVAALADLELAERRPDDGWHLRATTASDAAHGYSRARRDELRARSAQQLAVARQIAADSTAVVSRSEELRAARWRRSE
jgi:hypothetical protein